MVINMPRGFTDYEKEVITRKLRDAARSYLTQYGIRKTTVEELAGKADIAKGSFYQFYESKEQLFLDVIFLFHDQIQQNLLDKIEKIRQTLTPGKLTDLIFSLFHEVESSFMYPLLQSGELAQLIRMLPDESVKTHTEQDDLNMRLLLDMFPEIRQEKLEVFSAALRGIFFTIFYKRELGEEIFPAALRTMIHGIVLQIFAEEDND